MKVVLTPKEMEDAIHEVLMDKAICHDIEKIEYLIYDENYDVTHPMPLEGVNVTLKELKNEETN